MGRSRSRPVEASTFGDALRTIAPSPEQLEAFETMVSLLVFAFRHPEELERVVSENASVRADNTRLKAEITHLKAQRDQWQAAVADAKRAALALEQRGIRVQVPA